MAKYSFGEAIDEDDILEVYGVEYPMNPIGMRAMKRLLTMKKQVEQAQNGDGQQELSEADLDLAIDIVVSAVRPSHRDAIREQIDESVGPAMLVNIATQIMRNMSDVDPTQPESSSGGSSSNGSASTDGASVVESTPSL